MIEHKKQIFRLVAIMGYSPYWYQPFMFGMQLEGPYSSTYHQAWNRGEYSSVALATRKDMEIMVDKHPSVSFFDACLCDGYSVKEALQMKQLYQDLSSSHCHYNP